MFPSKVPNDHRTICFSANIAVALEFWRNLLV